MNNIYNAIDRQGYTPFYEKQKTPVAGAWASVCALWAMNNASLKNHEVSVKDSQDAEDLGRIFRNNIVNILTLGFYNALRISQNKISQSVENAENRISKMRNLWKWSSLQDQHRFVEKVNDDPEGKFKTLREKLTDIVYQPISADQNIKWLSNQEIAESLNSTSLPFYYHCTPSEANLQKILLSQRVKVAHKQAHKGAFVSTNPEYNYGSYALVFNRNIERLSPIIQTRFRVFPDPTFGQGYTAGFTSNILVTPSTLEYIILKEGSPTQRSDLAARCKEWTGREIKVISDSEAFENHKAVKQLSLGIPVEWPPHEYQKITILSSFITYVSSIPGRIQNCFYNTLNQGALCKELQDFAALQL